MGKIELSQVCEHETIIIIADCMTTSGGFMLLRCTDLCQQWVVVVSNRIGTSVRGSPIMLSEVVDLVHEVKGMRRD